MNVLLLLTVAPRVHFSSNRLIAEEGQNVSIACSATGQPQPHFTWSKSIGRLPHRAYALNKTLKITNVTKKDGGTYHCAARNILGSARDATLLMVFARLRFLARPPKELSPRFASPVHLPCVAESELKTTVTWLKDGKPSLPVDSQVLQNNTLVIASVKKSHDGLYTCRVNNVIKTIESRVQIKTVMPLFSCSVIKKFVSNSSGSYVIDPDGEGGLAPFTVYCDMRDKNGVGVTVISHDSESRTEVDNFVERGSYSRNIHYTGASFSQLATLTEVSSHCEQFIKYECYDSMLNFDSNPYGWWVSRDSKKMTYWGGASPGSNKCACGMTNSCANSKQGCHCDKNDHQWREDSGLLTDKTKLPVKQLRFGDTGEHGYDEKGYHTLGKLKCYGIAVQ